MNRPEWIVERDFSFEAAHLLDGDTGKAGRLHGHSWTATVRLRSRTLPLVGSKRATLVDAEELSKCLGPMVDEFLDHRYLNITLQTDRPTTEYVAWWIFRRLRAAPCVGDLIESVTISATCTSRATYREVPSEPTQEERDRFDAIFREAAAKARASVPDSSKGRTADFESANVGSSPTSGTKPIVLDIPDVKPGRAQPRDDIAPALPVTRFPPPPACVACGARIGEYHSLPASVCGADPRYLG